MGSKDKGNRWDETGLSSIERQNNIDGTEGGIDRRICQRFKRFQELMRKRMQQGFAKR